MNPENHWRPLGKTDEKIVDSPLALYRPIYADKYYDKPPSITITRWDYPCS